MVSVPMYSYESNHKLSLAYHANGDNLGSLTVSVASEMSRKKRQTEQDTVIWQFDSMANSGWRMAEQSFEHEGVFHLQLGFRCNGASIWSYTVACRVVQLHSIVRDTKSVM